VPQKAAVPVGAAVRPKAGAPAAPPTMATTFSHSRISTELKTIGILAGVLLVILIVLALVLS
jgi:hypothetical protein